jgi:hypothetical protein
MASVPVNPVSAGTTVVGLTFSGSSQYGNVCGVGHCVTGFTVNLTTTGNLGTEILQAYFDNGGTNVVGIRSGSTFSFSFPCGGGYFPLYFVLSGTASGTVQTTVTSASGNGAAGFYPLGLPLVGPILNVL